jgi:septum formation protein
MRTILASASPTRRKIFENLGVKFEVIPSDFDEKNPAKFSTKELVKYLAEGKAKSVYKKFEQENNFIVLGFDSLVELDGEIIGKLKTKKSALETFQKFRGKRVSLFSGVSIIGKFRGKFFQATDYEVSYIHFKADTTNCQIRDFLNYNEWQGKAGGIAVEGSTQFLIEKIEGDWNNILGVPVLKMNQIIRENLGKPPIKIFEKK